MNNLANTSLNSGNGSGNSLNLNTAKNTKNNAPANNSLFKNKTNNLNHAANGGSQIPDPDTQEMETMLAANSPVNAAPTNNTQAQLGNAAVLGGPSNALTTNTAALPPLAPPPAAASIPVLKATSATGDQTAKLTWIGYDFTADKRQVAIIIKTNPATEFNFTEESNRAGQNELVIHYRNTKPQLAMRWPIDASEFLSPVAYVRTRVTGEDCAVILTLRDAEQPLYHFQSGELTLTYTISDYYRTGIKPPTLTQTNSVLPSNWSPAPVVQTPPASNVVLPVAGNAAAPVTLAPIAQPLSNGVTPSNSLPMAPVAKLVDPEIPYNAGAAAGTSGAAAIDFMTAPPPAAGAAGQANSAPTASNPLPPLDPGEDSLDDFDDGKGDAPTAGEKFEL